MLSAVSFPIRRRLLALCLLSGALVIGVSGCGSASSSTATAAAATGSGSGSGSGSTSATYKARLNYAKCLRSHGVNAPDPSANGGPAGGGGGGGGFRALQSSPNFPAASQACAKYRAGAFGFANISPAQRAQAQQQLVKFATCMRSHGINIPDPSSTSGGGGFGILRQISTTERNSPAFQTAFKSCSSSLPKRPGGAPGA
jgi:hypothetical protein